MIPPRRQTTSVRNVPTAFGSQVPTILESYVYTILSQATTDAHEILKEEAKRNVTDRLKICQVPREEFEQAVVNKQAHPPEVKVDEVTDRVYLVGVGHPGREEIHLEEVPVDHEQADFLLQEQGYTKDDVVLVYTEIGWREFRQAAKHFDEMNPYVVQGLSTFFDIPPTSVTALILALSSYSRDDLIRIAQYALYHSASEDDTGMGQLALS